ncbi:MAG: hypothetical protein BWY17_00411 [Deltaproteobacteria bacterium ADurb.Bin207]|nr:MAG: hypothetical protein BWY17_00411 [Deltaproteobacteria bacterium ADurb.Bin207]
MKKTCLIALATAALLLGGCCKDKTSETRTEAAADGKGLGDPSNDPAIVAIAKPVLECKWTSYGFDSKCAAFESWKKDESLKDGKGDKTLVSFLEDADTKVQWLGADTLSRVGQLYRKDQVLATKVVDATDKVADSLLASTHARATGNIDLSVTGLGPRVMKMLQEHSFPGLRQELAGSVLFRNSNVPGMYDLFVKLARSDKDPKVRKAAAAAFWTGTPTGKNEEVCKLWLELADDADSDLAGHSAYHCSFTSSGGGCVGQWDALLSLIERKAKAGQVKSSFMAVSLKYFYGQKKATAAQKKRALEIAKTLVANTANDGSSRSSALEFVGKEDPAGKAFAAKYENDKEFFVKSTAKRIREQK